MLPWLALLAPCQSQTPAPTRLEQLEATYQANLRTLHAPVLQDYLRQLDLLKTQLTARGRAEDAKLVDAEIMRVKTLASTTGVMPYTPLQAPTPAAAPSSTPAVPAAKDSPLLLPTFLAAEAYKGGDLHRKTGALPIGTAEWRVFKLPAGTYDVVMVFACDALTQPETVTVRLGGQEVKATIAPERATGSVESFRLMRLCPITVPADIVGGILSLESASAPPHLWIRKLIFSKPRDPQP
ncbi:MAG: hypothetical protein ACOYMN_16965 [Roseimicrobium sp.]